MRRATNENVDTVSSHRNRGVAARGNRPGILKSHPLTVRCPSPDDADPAASGGDLYVRIIFDINAVVTAASAGATRAGDGHGAASSCRDLASNKKYIYADAAATADDNAGVTIARATAALAGDSDVSASGGDSGETLPRGIV